MSNKVTGDISNFTAKPKEGVVLHNIPNYPDANAKKKAELINDKAQSGKRLGAQVIFTNDDATNGYTALFVAAGSKPTDKWIVVKQISGTAGKAVDITPA